VREKNLQKIHIINEVKNRYNFNYNKYDVAKKFISEYLEIGLENNNYVIRNNLVQKINSLKNPHKLLMGSLNKILYEIARAVHRLKQKMMTFQKTEYDLARAK
jgi:hypothetical protein